MLSCGNDPLEKNYELDYNPMNQVKLVVPEKQGYQRIEILGPILFYGHNKDVILVNQKPTDSIFSSDKNLTLDKQLKMIFRSNVLKFWIITLKVHRIYGPLYKTENFKARNFLQVPDNLKMDNSTHSFYTDGKREDLQYYNPDFTVTPTRNLKGNSEKHNIKTRFTLAKSQIKPQTPKSKK